MAKSRYLFTALIGLIASLFAFSGLAMAAPYDAGLYASDGPPEPLSYVITAPSMDDIITFAAYTKAIEPDKDWRLMTRQYRAEMQDMNFSKRGLSFRHTRSVNVKGAPLTI